MQALLVTEILLNVLDFADRTTVARVARTCRAFEEPALDILWKELPTLDPLPRLLPDSTFESADDSFISPQKLRRLPSFEDWERLRKYTSRVVTIDDPSCMWLRNTNKLLVIVPIHPPESLCPMFPKLTTINASSGHTRIAPILTFPWVDGSSISRIVLEFNASTRDKKRLKWIGRLGASYPNVTRVDISITPDRYLSLVRSLQRVLSRSVCGWKHLTHVSFNLLDTAAYEHVARLDTIRSLELDISHIWPQLLRQAIIPPVPFPSLTDLSLTAQDTTELIEWISDHHWSLSTLVCRTTQYLPRPPNNVASLCTLIAANFCHQSLRSISLQNKHLEGMLVQVDSIKPLFAFSRIQTANLSFCATCIDDNGLRDLAISWPFLEVLHLTRYAHSIYAFDSNGDRNGFVTLDPAVFPTFRGLFYLVEHCPRLRELTMIMDTTDTSWVDVQNPCNGVRNCVLERFTPGNSPIDDPERVSLILASVFSRLREIILEAWASHVLSLAEHERWDELMRLWGEVHSNLNKRKSMPSEEDGVAEVAAELSMSKRDF